VPAIFQQNARVGLGRFPPVTQPISSRPPQGSASNAALEQRVLALEHHNEQLKARLAALEKRFGPRDAADERLLIAIAAAAGSLPFTSRQVVAHARTVPALAAAIQDAAIGSVRELGHLLRRVEGICIEGLRLERHDVVRSGIQWRIVRV